MPKRSKDKFYFKSSRFLTTKPTNATLSLLITGFLLLFGYLSWNFYQNRVLSFSSNYQQTIVEPEKSNSAPKRLEVSDLKINLAVEPAQISNGIWETNPKGASYLINSGYPGSSGNIILYGHNKKKILGSLSKAKKGQSIKIVTSDDKVYEYRIWNILIVNPNRVDILNNTAEETLTLYTCTGFMDSKRLIIQAKPV